MNKKILSLFVLLVVVLGATKALASLTFSSASITGNTASTIDVGTGNALSLQTTNNGAITTGTGMVTFGSSLTIPTTTSSTTGVIYKGATPFIHNFALPGTDGFNTFVGINAGNFTMTGSVGVDGSYNTAVGNGVLFSNTTGIENSAFGVNALALNTTGSNNVAIGDYNLSTNTTGFANTSIGSYAFRSNTTGNGNTVVGQNVLANNTTGINNTAMGTQSLSGNTTGSHNVIIGGNSGVGITTGSGNIILGASMIIASYNQITTGSRNISIGNDVAVADATASNQLNIGNLIYGTALDGTGATISTGNIGIGTKAPNAKLDINSNSFILETAQTPATSSSTCITGSIAWDASYVYVCVATNTWKRSAITTW